jgi:hypothetical protein
MSGDARQTWLVAVVALALGCGGSSAGPGVDGASGDANAESAADRGTAVGADDAAGKPDDAAGKPDDAAGKPDDAAETRDDAVEAARGDGLDVAAELRADTGAADATPADAKAEAPAPEVGPATGCADNRKNGQETDIDCGGPACPKCGLDQGCLADSDCGTWPGCDLKKGGCACDAVLHKCVVNHCVDHKQNVGESAIDCGGGECPGCAAGAACLLHSDCASGGCDLLSMTCATSHCTDHVFDSSETGLDCGGSLECPKCPVGQGCLLDFDCASGACDGISSLCVADPCADHQVDGSETDVDCGGSSCAPCPVGRRCHSAADCASGLVCTAAPTAFCEMP